MVVHNGYLRDRVRAAGEHADEMGAVFRARMNVVRQPVGRLAWPFLQSMPTKIDVLLEAWTEIRTLVDHPTTCAETPSRGLAPLPPLAT